MRLQLPPSDRGGTRSTVRTGVCLARVLAHTAEKCR